METAVCEGTPDADQLERARRRGQETAHAPQLLHAARPAPGLLW